MNKAIIILSLAVINIGGCAAVIERGTAHQDRELANNLAEVEYCHREICKQIRAETLDTYFKNDIPGWHAFCGFQ